MNSPMVKEEDIGLPEADFRGNTTLQTSNNKFTQL